MDTTNKRKVLFLIESLSGGSASEALSTLVQYIDKTKFDVTVCAIMGGGKYESVIKENVDYKVIVTGSVDSTKYKLVYKQMPLSWVYKFFIPQGYDVEIACMAGFATKLLSHSSNRKAKKYAWVHTDLHQNHWTKEVYNSLGEEEKAYNHYDKILGRSELVCKSFKTEFPNLKIPIEVIYNPIDSLSVRLKSLNVGEDNEKSEKKRLVSVGRLEAPQQYTRLLKVVNRLVKEGYGLELWIFGEGTQRSVLERYIKENDLKDSVKLFGTHPNPYKYMAQSDLYVCATYSSYAVEALILGLPVLTTENEDMSELLKGGYCGMMTKDTEESLYLGIKKLLDDSDLLQQYRQKGEARGWDFDIEALMVPIEKLLLEE